jgi:DNA-binding CsgD family transcriptional regulator
VVICGEAGIGKTALLSWLSDDAASHGWRLLRSACVEAEQPYPYAGLHQVLLALSDHVSELSDYQRTALDVALGRDAGEPAAVLALGTALLDLLVAAGSRTPCLVVIDDAHWLDDASAAVVTFVARRLSDRPAALVLAVRTGDRSSLDTTGIASVDVGPLESDSSALLLDQTHPELPAAHRAGVLARAAGNPLALLELAGWLDTTETVSPDLPLPRRLEQLYLRRLASLPQGEVVDLLLMALDGAIASDGSNEFQPAVADTARAAGLLDVATPTGRVAFRHPLVRSAVVQVASPNDVRAAHAQLAERHAHDPLRHAHHLAAATLDPDEGVARVLESAARGATRRGGAGEAVHLLTRASELSLDLADRDRRLADAAYVAGQAGMLDRAEALLGRSDRFAGDLTAPTSVLTAAYVAFYRDGAVVPAHRMLVDALRRRRRDFDPDTLDRAVVALLTISLFSASATLWQVTEQVVDELLEDLPAETLLYRDTWGDLLRHANGAGERLAHAFAAVSGEPWDIMRLAISAYFLDALGEYTPVLQRMVAREGDTGAITNVMTVLRLTVLDLTARGRWDEAEAVVERGVELSTRHGYRLSTYTFRAYQAQMLAERGATARSREIALEVDRWARPRGLGMLLEHVEAGALIASIAEGRYEQAWTYANGVATAGVFTPYSHESYRRLLDFVETALATGRADDARRHALAAVERGVAAVSSRMSMITTAALAMTDTTDAAGRLFEEATRSPAATAYPFDAARIRLAHGMWLRRRHATADARAVLTQAVDVFQSLGALQWLQRARHELELAGVATSDTPDGVTTLTAQERLIAELAATGLSNKQIGARLFLSPRTVGTHLYRIFPKLGITSRASLRDALSMGGLDQEDHADR